MKLKFARVVALVALLGTIGCSPGSDQSAARPPEAAPAKPKPAAKAPARPRAPARPMAPAVGTMAPDITGPDTDGVEFKLSDYRGKVVMIDFWGNW